MLVDAGFPLGRGLDALNALSVFVVGHASSEVGVGTDAPLPDLADFPLLAEAASTGVGASDEAPGPWHVEDAVSDLAAGLTELGATRDVILVSHSLSGEIATSFVNKNPHWVAGSVLVDASLPDFYTDSELTRIEAANSEQIEELKKQPSTKQTRQLIAVAENYGPWHQAYHQMSWPASTPATVIESAKTPFDTPEDAQLWRDAQAHFAEAAPNRYLVIAENSSHDVPIDRPDVVTDAVDGMAERLG
jgi:pimeloyl-ACP methyl ester carboxylesterase